MHCGCKCNYTVNISDSILSGNTLKLLAVLLSMWLASVLFGSQQRGQIIIGHAISGSALSCGVYWHSPITNLKSTYMWFQFFALAPPTHGGHWHTGGVFVCESDSVILVSTVMSHAGGQQAAQSCDLEDDCLLSAHQTCVCVCVSVVVCECVCVRVCACWLPVWRIDRIYVLTPEALSRRPDAKRLLMSRRQMEDK